MVDNIRDVKINKQSYQLQLVIHYLKNFISVIVIIIIIKVFYL
jgi:hypothetical protein